MRSTLTVARLPGATKTFGRAGKFWAGQLEIMKLSIA